MRYRDVDPREALGHQATDVDDDEDECAVCLASGINLTTSSPTKPLGEEIAAAYAADPFYANILEHLRSPSDSTLGALSRSTRNQINPYSLDGDLLTYSIDRFDGTRIVVPNDADLRARIIRKYHDAPWVRKWARTCEICQRVKPSPASKAPLRPLPIETEAWRSVSMNLIFGLPPDSGGRNGVLVFVDRFSKMVHLVPVADTVTAEASAAHFVDMAFRYHGLPESIVSDRDPRFTSAFWARLFELLGTRLLMSTAAHPETNGQTERVNRVLEDVLRIDATSFTSWSSFLPLAKFALNNAVHSSTGLTPFFVNKARHSRVPAQLAVGRLTESPGSAFGVGESVPAAADAAARSSSTCDAAEA
ncbi:hypothetical protein PC119_g19610 [Phytophthora cactorum]|nr:hypothetical protein PC114_g20093 [Phytophthora cactorum]KAG2987765.1 hypothetical protein PC119_g19610 [Phytophthora cactorum]KAG3139078.1 hypothetical protein C6341_g20482 [Phytophthora cactorum]